MAAEELVGRRVPGGTYRLEPYENFLARDALYADTPHGDPLPITAFMATIAGLGCSVRDLFALMDFDIDDGPMLASTTIESPRPMSVGVDYRVDGELVGVEPKTGRVLGRFDLVTWDFTVREAGVDGPGGVVARVCNVYALRRGAA